MVSKELQDKFYAAMESLKDGKNNYIVDALTAGAKATFESIAGLGSPLVNKEQLDNLKKINAGEKNESKEEPVTEGAESSDPGFIGKLHAHVPDEPVQSDEDYEPPLYPSKLTYDDLMKMTHDPSTEESEEPVDVLDHLTGNSGNRFPTYDGQFAGGEDYSMVAEAVTKFGNTIDTMKTTDNASILEAIKEGYKVCFEAIAPGYKPQYSILKNIGTRVASEISNLIENNLKRCPYKPHYKIKSEFTSDKVAQSYQQPMDEKEIPSYEQRIIVDLFGDTNVIININIEIKDSSPSGNITLTVEHYDADDSIYHWDSINPSDTKCVNDDFGACNISLSDLLYKMFANPDAPLEGFYKTFSDEIHGILGERKAISNRDNPDWWEYSVVTEAVAKLGNTIDAMKTTDNASLLEAIKEGYKVCFEGVQYGYEWKSNVVQPIQEAISQYEQPKPGNMDRLIRDTNKRNSTITKIIDDIQDSNVRDSIKASDSYKDATHPIYRRKVLKDIENNPGAYPSFIPEGAPDSDYFADENGYKSRHEYRKKPDSFHNLPPEVRSELRRWVRDYVDVSGHDIENILYEFPAVTMEDLYVLSELTREGRDSIPKSIRCYKEHPELKDLIPSLNKMRFGNTDFYNDPAYRSLNNRVYRIANEYGVMGTDETGERTAAADANGE